MTHPEKTHTWSFLGAEIKLQQLYFSFSCASFQGVYLFRVCRFSGCVTFQGVSLFRVCIFAKMCNFQELSTLKKVDQEDSQAQEFELEFKIALLLRQKDPGLLLLLLRACRLLLQV